MPLIPRPDLLGRRREDVEIAVPEHPVLLGDQVEVREAPGDGVVGRGRQQVDRVRHVVVLGSVAGDRRRVLARMARELGADELEVVGRVAIRIGDPAMPARHAGPVGDRRSQARKLVAGDRRHGVALHDQVGPRHQVRIGVRRRRVEDPDLVAVRLEVRDEQVRRLDGRVAVPAPADDDGELRWGSRHAGRGLRSNGGMGGRRDPRVRAGRRGRRVIPGDSPGGHRPSSITAPASAAALAAASIRRTAGLAARPGALDRLDHDRAWSGLPTGPFLATDDDPRAG